MIINQGTCFVSVSVSRDLIPVSLPGSVKRLGVLLPPPGRVATVVYQMPPLLPLRAFFCLPMNSVISCFRVQFTNHNVPSLPLLYTYLLLIIPREKESKLQSLLTASSIYD